MLTPSEDPPLPQIRSCPCQETPTGPSSSGPRIGGVTSSGWPQVLLWSPEGGTGLGAHHGGRGCSHSCLALPLPCTPGAPGSGSLPCQADLPHQVEHAGVRVVEGKQHTGGAVEVHLGDRHRQVILQRKEAGEGLWVTRGGPRRCQDKNSCPGALRGCACACVRQTTSFCLAGILPLTNHFSHACRHSSLPPPGLYLL